jgi:peptidyl-prolyl cis-trans isomerase A (cyclophilin A)
VTLSSAVPGVLAALLTLLAAPVLSCRRSPELREDPGKELGVAGVLDTRDSGSDGLGPGGSVDAAALTGESETAVPSSGTTEPTSAGPDPDRSLPSAAEELGTGTGPSPSHDPSAASGSAAESPPASGSAVPADTSEYGAHAAAGQELDPARADVDGTESDGHAGPTGAAYHEDAPPPSGAPRSEHPYDVAPTDLSESRGAADLASGPPPAALDPSLARTRAPDRFRVRFDTSRGPVELEVEREWAPHGADRFHQLVSLGFFDGLKIFRVVPGEFVEFGIHGDPRVSSVWREATIPDDERRTSNVAGTLSFSGAESGARGGRSTQIIANLADNPRLDELGLAPFARVVEGLDVLRGLFQDYGECRPRGSGPLPERIRNEGNAYLEREFPKLDSVLRARILPREGVSDDADP